MNRLNYKIASLLLAAQVAAFADVSYVEEVVNSGVGSKKRGARRTIHQVHIKGALQRVSTDIETSKEMTRVLQYQGATLQGTKILLLDQNRLYDINRSTGTYRQQTLPATKRVAPASAGKPAASAASADPNREITVRTRVLQDTMRIAGVLCHRVAAEMTARHFKPGTQTVQRVNRYLYQAWMADAFPGYDDIVAFRGLQQVRTSLAPLLRGGLDQLTDVVEDPERLETELENLRGFPMQSELKVFAKVGSAKERQLLRLSRRVLSLSHQSLPDSLFRPSRDLKSVK